MKKITTATGKFGPYNSVEVLSDRYHVDGADLPFTVIGQGEISDVVDGDFPSPEPYHDPEAYKYQRAAAYPSFADQFDLLYHGGMDAWKAAIQAVKDQYPKPE
jgi:hypothetical protein